MEVGVLRKEVDLQGEEFLAEFARLFEIIV